MDTALRMHGMSIRPVDPLVPQNFLALITLTASIWKLVPDTPGVYIIYDLDDVLDVGAMCPPSLQASAILSQARPPLLGNCQRSAERLDSRVANDDHATTDIRPLIPREYGMRRIAAQQVRARHTALAQRAAVTVDDSRSSGETIGTPGRQLPLA